MACNQIAPLRLNPNTGEPFLPLRNHPNIILTPPRLADAERLPPILNDPRVHEWLKGPPYPYTLQDAEAWLKESTRTSEAVLEKLLAAQREGRTEPVVPDGCPISSLREVSDNGTDTYIGQVTLDRWGFPLESAETKAQFVKENTQREPGDACIIWTIGDYLAPSHHGRGIMTDALETLLKEWAIPRMGVHHIMATTFKGNAASARVFAKLGFQLRETLDDYAEIKGKVQGFHVLEWKFAETRKGSLSFESRDARF